MNRRAFITGLGAVLAARLSAEAQQVGKVARIGFLSLSSGPTPSMELAPGASRVGLGRRTKHRH
jgi:hypothetical protein